MGIFDAFAAAGGATLSIDELNEKTRGDKDMLGKCFHSIPPSRSLANLPP